jgi:hypothetical protein
MKAFPEIKYVAPQGMGSHVMAVEGGMDLRDYFAAKVMQELVKVWVETDIVSPEMITKDAYKIADAMMEARK